MFFIVYKFIQRVLCACVLWQVDYGSAAMCGWGMRVAFYVNGWPAKPWKARDMQVMINICVFICVYGYICWQWALNVCTIVIAVQGSVARCMEGVFVWRKCVGDERGHQRPQYLQVCQVNKYVIFTCFSVLTTRFVCLCAFKLDFTSFAAVLWVPWLDNGY